MDRPDLAPLLEAVPLPMLEIGADWRIRAMNDAARQVFGVAGLERHFGLTFRKPRLVEAIEAVGRGAARQQLRLALPMAGHDATCDVTVAPVPGGGALVSFVDITEQEMVTQFRRDFVANVSHELRTPLTALLGFIETLQGPARDDAAARERFLGIMAREAGRMTRLVRDLLSLSRVEAQERQRPDAQVDLAGLLGTVAATLRPVAEEAGVTLTLDLCDSTLLLRGDGDQLTQVFHNLVENAVKYGGGGKAVTVRLRRGADLPGVPGPAVEVAVIDQGEGIEPQHLPRLTERFYRVDSHRSREKGGTGLGLAIVKHIVNRHRGRLRIESEKGKGSTFAVILPGA
ncbi:ATP-binding protein [Gemmobacter caeruleus]|uniref:ATP-binding protein n=1 Tax=Gemmobacter caeruleus TaxID=2595004 RepID=UPI0011EF7868|nr:ATP-binding protein [Gemmobacter caeruleus]